MTWVPAFDESYDRVPISQMEAAYNAGYRVIGGYAGGGNPDKWITRAEIDAWLSRPGTGIVALFEIGIADAVNHPERGDDHARAARAAWRALGYPDHRAIFAAVDTNVTLAQGRGPVTDYFRNWAAVDTCRPVAYVEADVGAILAAEGVTQGTFTPAAWGWNSPAVLYTPANAPSHVLWTQEHNGVNRYGGNLDIGHIRTTAPIWWAGATNPPDQGVVDMDEQTIAKAVWGFLVQNNVKNPDTGQPIGLVPAQVFLTTLNTGVNDLRTNLVPAIAASEQAEAATLAGLSAAIAQAVVAALPDQTGGLQGLTAAQVQDIVETAAADVLGRTTLTVAPPATGASGG